MAPKASSSWPGTPQGLGDLKGDDNSAAGDAEDDCVGAIGELGQVGGELASGVLTVLEDHGVTRALSLRGGPCARE